MKEAVPDDIERLLTGRRRTEGIGHLTKFAQIVGLQPDGKARVLADGSVQRQIGLRGADIAVGKRKLAIAVGVGGVKVALTEYAEFGQTAGVVACAGLLATCPLMFASARATRSAMVFPHVAEAVAFKVPANNTPGMAADSPACCLSCASEILCRTAVKLECELPPRLVIVPCAVTSPPRMPARKSRNEASP